MDLSLLEAFLEGDDTNMSTQNTTTSNGKKASSATQTTIRRRQVSNKSDVNADEGSANGKTKVTPQERERMIAEAAYYYSISSESADPHYNWLRAEREIDDQVMVINLT